MNYKDMEIRSIVMNKHHIMYNHEQILHELHVNTILSLAMVSTCVETDLPG